MSALADGSRCRLTVLCSTKAEVNAVAHVTERLVPIRLDMEIADDKDESRRYRDTFLWNAAGEQIVCSRCAC